MIPYIFVREDSWFPMEFLNDEEALQYGKQFPDILRIENMITNEVIWELTIDLKSFL